MTASNHIPEPQRLAEQPGTAAGVLLREAAAFEPPTGTQERIWRRLSEPAARMAEAEGESPSVVAVIRAAADLEPPGEAQERIWQRLSEEQAVRAGVAEPRRLVETDDYLAGLLARAASAEPAYGKQARIYRAVRERKTHPLRWGLPLGVLTTAMAALLLYVHVKPATPAIHVVGDLGPSLALQVPDAADLRLIHTTTLGSGNVAFAVGDSLVVGASGRARFQATGLGDIILGKKGTTLKLLQSDATGVHLALAEGRISMHADKRSRAAPLFIHAQGTVVEIVGTIFSVETTPTGPRVYVREGLVRVHSPEGLSYVGKGQSWPGSDQPIAPWAQEAMARLAGAVPVAVSRSHPAAGVGPATAEPAVPAVLRMAARATPPPGRRRTIRSPEAAPVQQFSIPLPTERKATSGDGATSPRLPLSRIHPLSGYFKSRPSTLNDLLSEDLGTKSLADLQQQKQFLRARGDATVNVTATEAVDYAITRVRDPSASPEELRMAKHSASFQLAMMLESDGHVRDAIDVRRRVLADPGASQVDKENAVVGILMNDVAINDVKDGLREANRYESRLPTAQRGIVLVFKAWLLAGKGDAHASDQALKEALSVDAASIDGAAGLLNGWALRAEYAPGLPPVLRSIASEIRRAGYGEGSDQ